MLYLSCATIQDDNVEVLLKILSVYIHLRTTVVEYFWLTCKQHELTICACGIIINEYYNMSSNFNDVWHIWLWKKYRKYSTWLHQTWKYWMIIRLNFQVCGERAYKLRRIIVEIYIFFSYQIIYSNDKPFPLRYILVYLLYTLYQNQKNNKFILSLNFAYAWLYNKEKGRELKLVRMLGH